MTSAEVTARVQHAISSWSIESTRQQQTLGTPWSSDRYEERMGALERDLVAPRLERFRIRDAITKGPDSGGEFVELWLVAASTEYVVFFDPSTGEFGLATTARDGRTLETAGVRGDLVGVYCAM